MPTKRTKVVFTWGHLTVWSHGLADINVKKTYCLRPLDIKINFVESEALSDFVSVA